MADKVTNYQCPACTGPLHFDSATGKLVCDYCGSAYEVADMPELCPGTGKQISAGKTCSAETCRTTG